MPASSYNLKPLGPAPLSKSKFTHAKQCELYVWLEVRTDLPQVEPDAMTQARFDAGDAVGELARQRWDNRCAAAVRKPGVRVTDDPRLHAQAVAETAAALADGATLIHEAAFTHRGVKVRIDVLERLDDGTFALHEVKSSARYDEKKHLFDAAVQLWVARAEGLDVSRVTLTHLNGDYVWPGGPYDLEQLFTETDVTEDALAVQEQVAGDVERIRALLEQDERPEVGPFPNCCSPYPCPYIPVCPGLPDPVDHPISELPKGRNVAQRVYDATGYRSLLELNWREASHLLTYASGEPHEKWINTWHATVTRERTILDGYRRWERSLEWPLHHFDFETVNPALPVIVGTRPYQVVPLQYSVHVEHQDGALHHFEFIANPDDPDPRRSLIRSMIEHLGARGSIIHWSQYEVYRLKDLIADVAYEEYRPALQAIVERLADLGLAVDEWVFDPKFRGRWSLKEVYPALVHRNRYLELPGTANGAQAAEDLLAYISPETPEDRRTELRAGLLAYCELDTFAQVEVMAALRE